VLANPRNVPENQFLAEDAKSAKSAKPFFSLRSWRASRENFKPKSNIRRSELAGVESVSGNELTKVIFDGLWFKH
jgi:hypothetical protein